MDGIVDDKNLLPQLSRQQIKLALLSLISLQEFLQNPETFPHALKAIERAKWFYTFSCDTPRKPKDVPQFVDAELGLLCDVFFDAFAERVWRLHFMSGLPTPSHLEAIKDLEKELLGIGGQP